MLSNVPNTKKINTINDDTLYIFHSFLSIRKYTIMLSNVDHVVGGWKQDAALQIIWRNSGCSFHDERHWRRFKFFPHFVNDLYYELWIILSYIFLLLDPTHLTLDPFLNRSLLFFCFEKFKLNTHLRICWVKHITNDIIFIFLHSKYI